MRTEMHRAIPNLERCAIGEEGSQTIALVVFEEGSVAVRCDRNPGQRIKHIGRRGSWSQYPGRKIFNYIEAFRVQSKLLAEVGARQDIVPAAFRSKEHYAQQKAQIALVRYRLACLVQAVAAANGIRVVEPGESGIRVVRRGLLGLESADIHEWMESAGTLHLEHPRLDGLQAYADAKRMGMFVPLLQPHFSRARMEMVKEPEERRMLAGSALIDDFYDIHVNERMLGRVTLSVEESPRERLRSE